MPLSVFLDKIDRKKTEHHTHMKAVTVRRTTWQTDKIIDLRYTIAFYYRVGADNLTDVWRFLRKNNYIDCNGRLLIKNGDDANA